MKDSFFSGKNILLTGATGSIGSAIARDLAAAGANLVLSSRSPEKLATLIASLPQDATIVSIVADLSQPGQAEELAQKAEKALGYINVLFNVAGLGYFALMEEAKEDTVRHLFELNTFSPMVLAQTLLPHMKARGEGRIINIVSCAGRVPLPTVGAYGSSKSALAIMANTMRLELAGSGIDIVNIYPGTVYNSFGRNALREKNRPDFTLTDNHGIPGPVTTAQRILEAAAKPSGEMWLSREGKWMAIAAIAWPKIVDRKLERLRSRTLAHASAMKPKEHRRWRLIQIESALACNLRCIMCPWKGVRVELNGTPCMAPEIWEAVKPSLNDIQSVDFTGGGEPLLQKNLFDWIKDAKLAGCEAGFLSNGLLLTRERAEKVINLGQDWIAFSIDGATKEVYEEIRQGSDFDTVCENISYLAGLRMNDRPKIMLNFVMMTVNVHQLEEIIKLAAKLGVNQVNFKQCDVIRGDNGKCYGLYAPEETKEVKLLQKSLSRAESLARKLNIDTTAFSFTPEEQSVCDQDPRNSLFISYNGSVSPCINLAIGGATSFLGDDVEMPTISYGSLPSQSLEDLRETETCGIYRKRFQQRVVIHNAVLQRSDFGHSMIKLQEAFDKAIEAMPDPPNGCEICHYLYGV